MPLALEEMQIKKILKFYLTPVRMAIRNTTTNVVKDAGEKGTLIHCWWELKLVESLRKIV
jgi:hypothetical protein